MFKPTAAFKLDQQAKRTMANYLNPHKRGAYKRAMIEAQLASLIQPRVVKSKKENVKEAE
jgi:hypothetical protein